MTPPRRSSSATIDGFDLSRFDPSLGLEIDSASQRAFCFGLAVDPDGWCAQPARVRHKLAARCEWTGKVEDDPGVFFGQLLGALAEVRVWVREGVPVAGRAWADLGGNKGYYALALVLEGARRAVVVDVHAPSPVIHRVLVQAGVEVVVSGAENATVADVDAALALYSCGFRAFAERHPSVDLAIVDRDRDEWQASDLVTAPRVVRVRVPYVMGCGACLPFVERASEIELHRRRNGAWPEQVDWLDESDWDDAEPRVDVGFAPPATPLDDDCPF